MDELFMEPTELVELIMELAEQDIMEESECKNRPGITGRGRGWWTNGGNWSGNIQWNIHDLLLSFRIPNWNCWISSRSSLTHSCLTSMLPAYGKQESSSLYIQSISLHTLTENPTLIIRLSSDWGGFPVHTANLHGSSAICSVIPNSDV